MGKDQHRSVRRLSKTLLHVMGMALFAAVVVSWFVWGPFGVVLYVAGLFNSDWVFLLTPLLFLLIAAAAILLPVQIVFVASRWRGLSRSRRWQYALLLAVVFAFVASFALGLAGVQPSPFDMYVRGFARYVEPRTDVEAIRNWLDALDPNVDSDKYGGVGEKRMEGSELPAAIGRLDPKRATVMPDDTGRPMVRLLWGGGLIGHWGLVIGHKDMPISPPDSSEYTEYHKSLAPGAYIWSGD